MVDAAYHHAWYLQHKTEHLARSAAYRKTHREACRGYGKNWTEKNKARIAARERRRHEENPAYRLWIAAKTRAKSRGLSFNLVVDDISIPEYCPVLGLKLEIAKGRMRDNSPSLDRIIPALGYIQGNVLVVSWRANSIKSDATALELRKVADFYSQLLGVPNAAE
jgi:hypothetical protein